MEQNFFGGDFSCKVWFWSALWNKCSNRGDVPQLVCVDDTVILDAMGEIPISSVIVFVSDVRDGYSDLL